MYVSKTDGGHQAAYLNRTRSLVGCRQVCPLRIQMKDCMGFRSRPKRMNWRGGKITSWMNLSPSHDFFHSFFGFNFWRNSVTARISSSVEWLVSSEVQFSVSFIRFTLHVKDKNQFKGSGESQIDPIYLISEIVILSFRKDLIRMCASTLLRISSSISQAARVKDRKGLAFYREKR